MYRYVLLINCVLIFFPSIVHAEVSAESCSVVAQGNNNATTIICGDAVFATGYTEEQFEARLKVRSRELSVKIAELVQDKKTLNAALRAMSRSGEVNALTITEQKRAIAEKGYELALAEAGLKKARSDLLNLDDAFKRAIVENQRLREELEDFRDSNLGIDDKVFEEAEAALEEGDTASAEAILNTVKNLASDKVAIERQAKVSIELGKIAEQKFDYLAAKDHFLRAAQLEPNNEDYLNRAQRLTRVAGNYQLSARYAQDYLDLVRKNYGEEGIKYASALNKLGYILVLVGEYHKSEELMQKALSIYKKETGEGSNEVATMLNQLSMNLTAMARYEEAIGLLTKSIKMTTEAFGEKSTDLAYTYVNLGNALIYLGRNDEAEEVFRKALEIRIKKLGENHYLTGATYSSLAVSLMVQFQFDDVEEIFLKAIEIKEDHFGKIHPGLANDYTQLARSFQLRARYYEADPIFRKALEISELTLGKYHDDTGKIYRRLASNLAAMKRYGEAELMFREALKILELTLGSDHFTTYSTSRELENMLANAGNDPISE